MSGPATQDDLGAFDLIVVGAGINGAGIARDAALRGLRVLLLDKGDVASGTTSWSTRLIHGGLRYLEHGEVGLVRESLRERERLLAIAPHLVRPLPLLFPIYRGDARGARLIRAGMVAYDVLSFSKSLPRHRMLDAAEVLRREPGVRAEGLRGGALYYDAQAEFPERLALENALDARDHGAVIRTYHRVDRILTEANRIAGVSGHDVLTDRAFCAAAPAVINVAGPWVDSVLAAMPHPVSNRLIGGTKGSHIVVAPFAGAPRDAIYAEARRDRRPFFIIPWNDAYLIGTTDVRYDGSLDHVVAEEWEIDWLLEEASRVIPRAHLARSDVRYAYSGIRPLPYAPTAQEGSVTRRHEILDHHKHGGPAGLYSIVGGKLTTYRELAEQAVDTVMRASGQTMTRSRTAATKLPGARSAVPWPRFCQSVLRQSGLPEQTARHLLRVYGARAADVLASATTPEMRQIVDAESGAIAAEVPWAFHMEGARTLADVVARRTMSGLGLDAGIGADAALADVARATLGWSDERAAAEVAAYRCWARRYRPLTLEAINAACVAGSRPTSSESGTA